MMWDLLLRACEKHFVIMKLIQETYGLPLAHVISPPPLAAEDLSDILPPRYSDRGAEGIAPPALRLKSYEIQSNIGPIPEHPVQQHVVGGAAKSASTPTLCRLDRNLGDKPPNIFREFCMKESMEVIEPPELACDEDGFLKWKYRSNNATHVDKEYGALVLEQIKERING